MTKKPSKLSVEAFKHDDKRRNIPTAEYQSLLDDAAKNPVRVAYERRNRDLDPQLVWRGKDEQDWSDLVVQAPPLYIQEKVHPKVIIDDLVASDQWLVARNQNANHDSLAASHSREARQPSLFSDFNGIPESADKTEFYQHDANWTNRLILGDSLQVMASLAEREGLRGKVQCIYLDPPYGIKFNSNFQWSTTSRDVKDGNAAHITREPEQVKAFRDTWRDGIHSYLTYLRDRLTVARDLLSDSGSIFVQIGDENVHRVRALLEEVFGQDNLVADIIVQTTTSASSVYIDRINDHILWFAKNSASTKYRQLTWDKVDLSSSAQLYRHVRLRDGRFIRSASPSDFEKVDEPRIFRISEITSQTQASTTNYVATFQGKKYPIGKRQWSTPMAGMERLKRANRVIESGSSIAYVRMLDDYAVVPLRNLWTDTGTGSFTDPKIYVVQTNTKIIQRCILMSTDPGDLVLDPTCGSGTTAYVAEQWGRRWITIDTSRVALALARARIMGARYPYYLLADSPEGKRKEAEVSGLWLAASEETNHYPLATNHSLRQGFVYERVPHITLKAIANNTEIDVIWEKYQETLEGLRERLNAVLSEQWLVDSKKKTNHQPLATTHSLEEWEIPRERPEQWPPSTQPLLTAFWAARVNRQREIDASIAAKAEFEYLYDKPYEDRKKVRVAGPFTVESLSPHRVLAVDENDELVASEANHKPQATSHYDFAEVILENLRTSGVQQAHKEDKISFSSLVPWPGDFIAAEGRFVVDSEEWLVDSKKQTPPQLATNHYPLATEKRAALFIGPEFGTVTRPDLVAAAREAADAGFDVLIACAFSYDAHSSEFGKLGKLPVLKARMNADLHMADDLKNTGKGNLFVIFGEPDIEVASGQWLVASNGRMIANYERVKELSGLGSLEEINRLGRADLSSFKELSTGGKVWADQPGAKGSGVGAVEHRGGSSANRNGGVPSEPERSQRVAGRSGDAANHSQPPGNAVSGRDGEATQPSGRNQQNAGRSQALAAIKTLSKADFPLSLTTSHYSQVTIHGVDVFHPNTGEVRSDGAEGIACWFIDTDYNEESFFVRQAYFLGANDPYRALKTTLKAEINEEAWESLNSDTSRPFEKPSSGRIAVKVINHLGDEVMKVFRVG